MSSIYRQREQQPRTGLRLMGVAIAAGITMLAAPYTKAETGGATAADAQMRYQQERARCTSGESGQDYATCLREAGAALQAARHGQLNDGDARYHRNALERCKALPPDDAKDCRDRINGQGTVSGSVKGGGLYREKVTVETKVMPVPEPAQQPAPAPAQ